mmetsp:Transcript_55895/g.120932  ORF Transcript_55895/g.120932 Transcript_55895/m.120932 type:complete len:1035 (-) Transcript_55895:3-3107(-)
MESSSPKNGQARRAASADAFGDSSAFPNEGVSSARPPPPPWKRGNGNSSRPLRRLRGLTENQKQLDQRSSSPRKRSTSNQAELTKTLLWKEIEARKNSDARRFFSPDKRTHSVQRSLLVISPKLPLTVIIDEDTGDISCDWDPSETNVRELLSSTTGSHVEHEPFPPEKIMLVGEPVVRRRSDLRCFCPSEAQQIELEQHLRTHFQVVPVFLPSNRDHFADQVLYPLFHYSLPSVETGLRVHDWEGYELINGKFRDVVLKEYTLGDFVWINDYPLMLLPKLLRKERVDMTIGFYIHCVFPSSEVYRILPQREQLLRGILSANVIGFHNVQYMRRFLTTCTRILGLECTMSGGKSGIEACEDAGGTYTRVIAVPLGINLQPGRCDVTEEKQGYISQLEETFAGKKIIVAVDRLEAKGGIPHKMMAFHKFLQKEPSWAARCVFVQSVTPVEEADTDLDVGEQQRLLYQIYQMVGEVNSKFGTIGHLPVHFLCQRFRRTQLEVLFAKANAMLDTPLRDLLSRSAHEFLSLQHEEQCGVLILSEFSGSAPSLRAAALVVNPWDTNGFADAIQEALEMEVQDRLELHHYGHRYVSNNTLQQWAASFLEELQTAATDCETERLHIPPRLDHEQCVQAMRKASRRLIVLGYCGTLLPQDAQINPQVAQGLPPTTMANLQVLCNDPTTKVVVVTGFDRYTMAKAVGSLHCWVIAEGGFCFSEPGCKNWHTVEQRDTEWMGPVKEIMQYFAARTPGSRVVESEAAVAWQYNKTQGDHAAIQSKELLIHLWAGPLLCAPAEINVEQESVVVRASGVSLALQLERMLHELCCEEGSDRPMSWMHGEAFVLCIGDFTLRNEDVFVTTQKFFDPETWERKVPKSPNLASPSFGSPNLGPQLKDLLEVESILSTKPAFHRSDTEKFARQESAEDGLGSLKKNASAPTGMLLKIPSEPDIVTLERGISASSRRSEVRSAGASPRHLRSPDIFNCTMTRKVTRAAHYLCGASDVAFLLAKLARELRQVGKEAKLQEGAGPSRIITTAVAD